MCMDHTSPTCLLALPSILGRDTGLMPSTPLSPTTCLKTSYLTPSISLPLKSHFIRQRSEYHKPYTSLQPTYPPLPAEIRDSHPPLHKLLLPGKSQEPLQIPEAVRTF